MKTIFLGLITLMFLGSGVADAGPYRDSAHGNTTYGVDRTSTSQYTQGHCAHCHEQHASIGGDEPTPNTGTAEGPDDFCLLANNFDTTATTGTYAQDDNACFYCHYGLGTYQATAFDNYSYSRTFGGNSDTTPASIMEAFNLTSYHNLKDVIDWATDGWPATFTADSNPCSACHNVHIAQRSCGKPTGSYDPAKSAISKPSVHDELWGDTDDAGERMDEYPRTYKAPYYYGGSLANPIYEPDGSATSDGSNLPNYAAFCLDCHVNAVEKGATSLNAINWTTSGTGQDKHGQDAAGSGGGHGELIAPYVNDSSGIYALSCTDCHEPHGSSNEWLLRTEVNAKSGISITTTGVWYEFCTACHSVVLGGSGSHSGVEQSDSCSAVSSCHKHGDKF